MARQDNQILSNATRSTLFGRFYERILRKWLEIFYISEILNQCIKTQPNWYRDIINDVKGDIDNFFGELLKLTNPMCRFLCHPESAGGGRRVWGGFNSSTPDSSPSLSLCSG